eukprot:CAMPEP_0201169524 /NCGR_PEP_ID=MMETSP0851-20130426/80461_1 /ASSEMBLY_ACC=CAM_ASM_000631 /TAXON_ID=183588 /ORGANISM="Pseudo-nitzschia fraudulenta, Strain WWA7" /LENGTH=244 /DNA_ID=CAMNT_0047451305 /DNA_START=37 /DNA_END=771 /DNA_ORIENTATION=-
MNATSILSARRIGVATVTMVRFFLCVMCALQVLQQSANPRSIFVVDAFVPTELGYPSSSRLRRCDSLLGPAGKPALFAGDSENESNNSGINKFGMAQRIESLKSVVLGALSGGIAVTPIAYLHYVSFATGDGSIAQWEFVTDMSSLQAALFAIVYRYAVRANDNNPMLNQGVVGAFIVVRTLSNIQVTDTCQSIPLRCGPPLGYFDWSMIEQAVWGGVESAALFGAASFAMELAFRQKWISRFY